MEGRFLNERNELRGSGFRMNTKGCSSLGVFTATFTPEQEWEMGE